MSNHLTPSAVIERIIGRPEVIGAAIGADPKAAYVWRKGSKNRDEGDIPSARNMRALLAHAAARGLPLTADDLIWGADAADIEARLAPTGTTADGPEFAQAAVRTGGGLAVTRAPAPADFISSRGASPRVTGAHLQADAPRAAGSGSPVANSCASRRANGCANG